MPAVVIAYIAALLVMVGLDFTWFSLTADPVYHRVLGAILADDINYPAAVVFYLVYVLGVVIFAIKPALDDGDWRTGLLRGALFGFFAYATYDLTNLATLKVWSLKVSLIDVAWGTFCTGFVSGAASFVTLLIER